MVLSQNMFVSHPENSSAGSKLVQNCKDYWITQASAISNLETNPHLTTFHSQLWNILAHVLATGNDQILLDYFRSQGQEMARLNRPLPQVIEQSGYCLEKMIEQAMNECELNPELSTDPKALHNFLKRFNQVCSQINTAIVQGYTAQQDAPSSTATPFRPKSRLEKKSESLELFKQLASVVGPGQFMVNRYRPNSALFTGAASPQNCFYFVREGTVQLQEFLPDGRAVVLAILGRGDVFARTNHTSTTGYFRDFHALALRETEVVLMEEEALRLAMEKAPSVAIGIIKSFSSQLAEIQQVIEGLLSRDIAGRLTHILLQLADEFGIPSGDGTLIDYPLTHQQLADMLGSNRVTITRRLGDLQKQGLLEVNRHAIIIYDRERLEQIAC